MSVSHASTPSRGTSRRVLGDLTPKALNTPSKRADAADRTRAQSPLKQMQTLSPQLFHGKENAAAARAPQGKKRSISEVDDPERVEDAKVRVAATPTPPTPPPTTTAAAAIALSAAAVRLHTDTTATDLLVPGSPTERNTPTPEPELEPVHDAINSQGSQNSFSALINYDLCASQQSVIAPPARLPSPPTPAPVRTARAERVRTRLGFGIYKVKTNQVEKRSTDIISMWESSFSDPADASMSGESKDMQRVHNINRSPTRPDPQPVFIKANLDPFRPIGKLTPAPILLPPTTSSRIIHEYDMPSSPPRVVSPEQLRSPAKQRLDYTTPINQSPRSEKTDGDSKDGSAQSGLRKMQRLQESELTSSAVKGNAAKGLMQLMAGRR